MFFLFQDVSSVIKLGWGGTIAWAVLQVMLIGIAAFFYWKSQERTQLRAEAESARNALGISDKEKSIWRERAERLDGELSALNTENAALRAKTDLKPVLEILGRQMELLTATQATLGGQIEETRKFQREYGSVQSGVATILEKLMSEESEGHTRIFEILEGCQGATGELRDSIVELREQIADDRRETSAAFAQVTEALQGIVERIGTRNTDSSEYRTRAGEAGHDGQ